MITIKIKEQLAVDILMDRVAYWTDDSFEQHLYENMYENFVYNGVFEDYELDPMKIVDNDYINYCRVVYCDSEDEEWERLFDIYAEQGLGDCSCECDFASYIEAVDNEDNPTMFLIRM